MSKELKQKKQLTPQQIYKKNLKKSKTFKRLAPLSFWLFIFLSGLFASLAFSNSVGNVTDIISKLDKDVYNRTEIAENYSALKEQWGEWTIIGDEGSLTEVKFINIKKAMFGGLMISQLTLAVLSLFLAFFLGKLLFPKLSLLYSDSNQDMVNLATLDTQAEIKAAKKEWF